MEKDPTEIKDDSAYMTGRLLLAMPAMGDPRFYKAVILMCAHDKDGAMGLVLNHTLPGIDMEQLFKQLDIKPQGTDKNNQDDLTGLAVMSGGPVETARGFILHSNDFVQEDSIDIDDNLRVTGTVEALKAIARGERPENMLFVLGYAGWSAEQLDSEIQDNAWLVVDSDPDIIFETKPEDMWDKAVRTLGIEPGMLSSEAGRA